ncbi:MAG: 3-hydroxyacyl-ACP dehydratase [Bacteroidetes bacterium]|nr:3-hydroxyacyl-ACP dehydratase [Bacteroidota bacterium]
MNKLPDILSLIPQRHPFVMVDALLEADEKKATSIFKIEEKNIFFETGRLAEAALVENIAQTAAARIGYLSVLENKTVPVGFLGAVQNFEVFCLPQLHQELTTEIAVEHIVFNAAIISGYTRCGATKIASCTMKIFILN